jgi:hypothetical protein
MKSLVIRLVALSSLLLSLSAPAAHATPEGTMTWGVHVTLAARWLDPSDTEAFITPESKSELACLAYSRLEEWREQRATPNASSDGRVESIRDQRAMHEDEMPIVGGTPGLHRAEIRPEPRHDRFQALGAGHAHADEVGGGRVGLLRSLRNQLPSRLIQRSGSDAEDLLQSVEFPLFEKSIRFRQVVSEL